jgi:hypothetical protein
LNGTFHVVFPIARIELQAKLLDGGRLFAIVEAKTLQPRIFDKAVTIVAQSVQLTVLPRPPPLRRKARNSVQRKFCGVAASV